MRQLTSSDPAAALREAGSPFTRDGSARAAAGFTLIELMVTLAVAVILTIMAVPAFQDYLRNDRDWTDANTLVMSLDAARSEAIKEDASVSVCPSVDGTSCSTTTPWSQGWIVLSSATGATPMLTEPALASGMTLTEASGLTAVTFQSTGMVAAAAKFTLCDQRGGSFARFVQVNLTGSVASSPTVGKNLSGLALSCP